MVGTDKLIPNMPKERDDIVTIGFCINDNGKFMVFFDVLLQKLYRSDAVNVYSINP